MEKRKSAEKRNRNNEKKLPEVANLEFADEMEFVNEEDIKQTERRNERRKVQKEKSSYF